MNGMPSMLQLHPNDNVAIARNTLAAGTTLNVAPLATLSHDVPAAHKIATRSIAAGEAVRRYGQVPSSNYSTSSCMASTSAFDMGWACGPGRRQGNCSMRKFIRSVRLRFGARIAACARQRV
jgi:hypothetical protein